MKKASGPGSLVIVDDRTLVVRETPAVIDDLIERERVQMKLVLT